ncbi:MAG: hypothetical protein NT015_10935 [Alphaproteobacteria bacterium]|nr:hypothetical protein [Alphaproteobacteria bacterium]
MPDLGPLRSLADEITLSDELLPGWTRAFMLHANGQVDVTLTGPANLSGAERNAPSVIKVTGNEEIEHVLRKAVEIALSRANTLQSEDT